MVFVVPAEAEEEAAKVTITSRWSLCPVVWTVTSDRVRGVVSASVSCWRSTRAFAAAVELRIC